MQVPTHIPPDASVIHVGVRPATATGKASIREGGVVGLLTLLIAFGAKSAAVALTKETGQAELGMAIETAINDAGPVAIGVFSGAVAAAYTAISKTLRNMTFKKKQIVSS